MDWLLSESDITLAHPPSRECHPSSWSYLLTYFPLRFLHSKESRSEDENKREEKAEAWKELTRIKVVSFFDPLLLVHINNNNNNNHNDGSASLWCFPCFACFGQLLDGQSIPKLHLCTIKKGLMVNVPLKFRRNLRFFFNV